MLRGVVRLRKASHSIDHLLTTTAQLIGEPTTCFRNVESVGDQFDSRKHLIDRMRIVSKYVRLATQFLHGCVDLAGG